MKRPLWIIGIAYAAALLIAPVAGLNASVLLGALCLASVFCALLFPSLRKRRAVWAALLAAAAAFCAFFGMEALRIRPLSALYGTEQWLEGQVTEVGGTVCTVKAYTGGLLPAGGKVRLFYDKETPPPSPYDSVRARVVILEPGQSPSLQDKAAGIYLQAACTGYGEEAMETSRSDAGLPQAVLIEARRTFLSVIRRDLPGEEGALAAALCLGVKDALHDTTVRHFQRTGLSHLLAVSGLHMSIIAQAALALLLFLKVPRRCAAGLTAAVVLLFMLLTGLSASVVRAGVMCLVVLLAQILSRDADSLNSMGLALLILTVPNPFAVWDVGLLLSFASTLGLITLAPPMKRGLEKLGRLLPRRRNGEGTAAPLPAFLRVPLHALGLSACATLPALPIAAVVFRELPAAAPLANLLGIYAATVILITGCLAMVCGAVPFLGWAAHGLLLLAGGTARYLLRLTEWLSGWSGASVFVGRPWVLVWLIGSLGLLWLGWRLLGKKGLLRAGALTVLLFSCGLGIHTAFTRGVTTITSLEAGDNLALLLERDGQAGLVIAGETPGQLTDAAYDLRRRGVNRLDFLIVPAWDGGMAAFLPAFTETIAVGSLVYPAAGPYQEEAAAAAAGVREWTGGQDAFTFWNDSRLECHAEGWIRLQLGDTRVLLCPPAGNTAALPDGWRDVHLAVFTGVPPLHATSLRAQGAFFGCYPYQLPLVTKALPWGVYPIRLTAGEGDVTAATRGAGDVTIG